MELGKIRTKAGEDITELVMNGEYILWQEASECVERILSRIRANDECNEDEDLAFSGKAK